MRDINFLQDKNIHTSVNPLMFKRVFALCILIVTFVSIVLSIFMFLENKKMDERVLVLKSEITTYAPARDLASEVKHLERYLDEMSLVLEKIDRTRLNQMKALRILSNSMPSRVGLTDYRSDGHIISYNAVADNLETIANFSHALKSDENVESLSIGGVTKGFDDTTGIEELTFNMEVTLKAEEIDEEISE